MDKPKNAEDQGRTSNPEGLLVSWAFDGGLPYDMYPEDAVNTLNGGYGEFMFGPVALSHYISLEDGKEPFPEGDVVQGEFRGFDLTDDSRESSIPVGIRIYANLTPGSRPGIHREELYPLWSEEEESLKIPNFDYRPGESIWGKIVRNGIRSRS